MQPSGCSIILVAYLLLFNMINLRKCGKLHNRLCRYGTTPRLHIWLQSIHMCSMQINQPKYCGSHKTEHFSIICMKVSNLHALSTETQTLRYVTQLTPTIQEEWVWHYLGVIPLGSIISFTAWMETLSCLTLKLVATH